MFFLFDRVVNVQNGIVVPFGMRGSVIGIHEGNSKYYKVLLQFLIVFSQIHLLKGYVRKPVDLSEIRFEETLLSFFLTYIILKYHEPLQIRALLKMNFVFCKFSCVRVLFKHL